MKTVLHRSATRGHASHGWLDSRFTFSFANYYDPERMHFGMLRVLNDDLIAGGGGFELHPHDNMEIITIVLEGELEHKDNMGHIQKISPNEVQVMTAGTGIFHSEYNKNPDLPLKLLQVWVFPEKRGLTPRYDQKAFDPMARVNEWQILVSPDTPGALMINRQAWFSRITLDESLVASYALHNIQNGAYVFVIDGHVEVGGHLLDKRDGLGVSEVSAFSMSTGKTSEILVIEVPMR